jgi:hypothetical protein
MIRTVQYDTISFTIEWYRRAPKSGIFVFPPPRAPATEPQLRSAAGGDVLFTCPGRTRGGGGVAGARGGGKTKIPLFGTTPA